MNYGEYAVFTDGSWTARRPNREGVKDNNGDVIWDEEAAGWGCQIYVMLDVEDTTRTFETQ